MDNFSVLAIFIVSFLLSSSPEFAYSATITSCSQTPYPDVCNYFIGNTNGVETLDETKTQTQTQTPFTFRHQSLFVTMNQAIKAHQLISSMDLSSFNDQRSKLAWTDCLELYDYSIDHLNRSMSAKNPFDAQTWLSATMANQQTCKNGFLDFNLASHLDSMPFMLSNFSKLLSNSLAINKASIISHSSFAKQRGGNRRLLDNKFPSWVSASDRKLLQTSEPKADIVVAQDGSGNYKTISAAVAAASGGKRVVIYVKKGVYKENVEIKRSLKNIMMVGDGIDATIITGSKNAQDGTTTFDTATLGVSGDGFIAKDMTFENTAGPAKHQAVALRSGSDFSVFYRCSFKGYQDTLYVYSMRQFYRDCNIYGTVDFIFGDAAVVLQNCNIYIRKPMSGQWTTVTAQGRTDPNENTGIVIHNSVVTGASDLTSGSVKCYLGRPWKKYSRTVFMKSTLDGIIDPKGWLPWSGSFALNTLYYGEYSNTGSGASTSGRVSWPGYHVITSPAEAGKFTVGNFLGGGSWISSSGAPFDTGL